MSEPDELFQRRLMATFRGEAEEHMQAISHGLIELETAPGDEGRASIVERVYREAHTLKGAARAVDLREIEGVCQSLESVLAQVKRREVELTPDTLDVLHRAVDEVGRLLGLTRAVPRDPGHPEAAAPADGRPVVSESASDDVETVRVPAGQLDRLLLEVEELLPVGMGAVDRSEDLRALAASLSAWSRRWGSLRSDARLLRQSIDRGAQTPRDGAPEMLRLLDFLEWSDELCGRLESRLGVLSQSAERDQRFLRATVDTLLRDTKLLLLRPLSSLTEAFAKLVHDLCRAQGKEAALSVSGAQIEIDRRILQEIKDPLTHLLRNCVDHGIETPEGRRRANKAIRGSIAISIEQRGSNRVEIRIRDDGAGVDPEQVREAAVRSGLVAEAPARAMGDAEILAYVFQSGVSTSPIVTEISGRGLGMAIVREKVEELGGDVTMETGLGEGTTFRIHLPLTVSTIRGILVRLGEQRFVLPATFVERVAAVAEDAVRTVKNQATVLMDGLVVSFARLRDVLSMPPAPAVVEAAKDLPLVVLAASDRRVAFQVDEVLGEQEVLVKSLGPQLERVKNIAGAAVLGTGKVVPILHVADLMKSAAACAFRPAVIQTAGEPATAKRRSILVADDSITARTLLKNILEGAGYLVRTAVDGAEAFLMVREAVFDLVVSDVEMPGMNGFDLTARIRADRKLSHLPVILVTGLESREDRERGIDAGANAYVVKSSFEQSNLLDIVRRFAQPAIEGKD